MSYMKFTIATNPSGQWGQNRNFCWKGKRITVGCSRVKTGDFHKKTIHRKIYFYQEVTSTNDIAREIAKSGCSEGTIVVSEVQTAGRGRLARQWFCPEGKGLLMSMVVRPQIPAQNVPQLSLLAGVVIAETIKKVTRCQAGLKWPNDVLINGKKVCGILAESSISAKGTLDYVIIGIGINLNMDKTDLPAECHDTSTSIKMEIGKGVSRLAVLRQFIITWEENYRIFLQEESNYLFEKWINNNVTLGRTVTIARESETTSGLAVGISGKGGLLVKLPDGDLEEYLAGDVSLGKKFYEEC